jgi:hypothetical protein
MKGGVRIQARLFLPETPTTWTSRRHERCMTQSATQHNTVETNNGVFRYRGKPLPTRVSRRPTSRRRWTQPQEVVADGYTKGYAGGNQLSVSGFYNDSWFTGAGDRRHLVIMVREASSTSRERRTPR